MSTQVLYRAVVVAGMLLSPVSLLFSASPLLSQGPAVSTVRVGAADSPWVQLMSKAVAHAKAHRALVPALSPVDSSVAPEAFGKAGTPAVAVAELQAMGIRVVPWTTNDAEKMRAVIRTGVDGLISDRPDVLQQVVAEERVARQGDARLRNFVVSAHRGGRGLRPENTLPSFESGLDQLATELETDTGVSTDGVSLIWHDQFFNPQACRRADGKPYELKDRVYLRDVSVAEAQAMFVCDVAHFHTVPGDAAQKNDLALSPVAVAFAAKEKMASPYAPVYVAQLFRFVRFYADWYATGAGKGRPHAAERAANARTVRFNIETKILPDGGAVENHTVAPQKFVDALAGVIVNEAMESRAAIQSFDFRTLLLVAEQYPTMQTIYLTDDPKRLSTAFVPEALRVQ